MLNRTASTLSSLVAAILMTAPLAAQADAVRAPGQFIGNQLPPSDDGFARADVGFTVNFYGNTQDFVFVNTNGNATFAGGLQQFSPEGFRNAGIAILAPFWADADTRGQGQGTVRYGAGSVNGHSAFAATWDGVGYYNGGNDLLNVFQLVLIQRADTGAASNFDFEFNFGKVQWETGDASHATSNFTHGLGDYAARVGYTNGDGKSTELTGSGVAGALIDGGQFSLVKGSYQSDVSGRYLFAVRDGVVVPLEATQPPVNDVPEPASLLLAGGALFSMAALARRRRQR